jgi:hypothetical protein
MPSAEPLLREKATPNRLKGPINTGLEELSTRRQFVTVASGADYGPSGWLGDATDAINQT